MTKFLIIIIVGFIVTSWLTSKLWHWWRRGYLEAKYHVDFEGYGVYIIKWKRPKSHETGIVKEDNSMKMCTLAEANEWINWQHGKKFTDIPIHTPFTPPPQTRKIFIYD